MNKLDCTFALIDVKRGRKKLAKHFASRPGMGECPEALRIPIVIHGYIDGIWGSDDGESQEFTLVVERCEKAEASNA